MEIVKDITDERIFKQVQLMIDFLHLAETLKNQ